MSNWPSCYRSRHNQPPVIAATSTLSQRWSNPQSWENSGILSCSSSTRRCSRLYKQRIRRRCICKDSTCSSSTSMSRSRTWRRRIPPWNNNTRSIRPCINLSGSSWNNPMRTPLLYWRKIRPFMNWCSKSSDPNSTFTRSRRRSRSMRRGKCRGKILKCGPMSQSSLMSTGSWGREFRGPSERGSKEPSERGSRATWGNVKMIYERNYRFILVYSL